MQSYIVRLYVVGAVLNQRLIDVMADSEANARVEAEKLIKSDSSLFGYAIQSITVDD